MHKSRSLSAVRKVVVIGQAVVGVGEVRVEACLVQAQG